MKLIFESNNLEDYLKETEVLDFSHPVIVEKSKLLFSDHTSDIEKARDAFFFVRDEVKHSWDVKSKKVTCAASEVVVEGIGICYAKSNLLAALLRSAGIPAGFCYQRLMLFDQPDEGYSLHALNAVFLKEIGRWIRLDARGNKPGVEADFSLGEEKLAFSVREHMNEKDYPTVYIEPNKQTIAVLQQQQDATEMYLHHLPERI